MTNDQTQARAKMIADTVACLKYGWNVRKIGEAGGSIILCDESRHERLVPTYDWIYLCDNGGEFNVGRINHGAPVSVAYTGSSYFDLLDGGTMAYRMFCAIRGEEIDYEWRGIDIIEDARKAA